MIPVPPSPGDVLPAPEPIGPISRGGGEPVAPLVLQAFEEIEDLKRSLTELRRRLEALGHRLAGIDTLEQRIAALEAGRA